MNADIPEFPVSRDIRIGDRNMFESFLGKMKRQASEYNFTNLFLWGKARKYEMSMLDGHILVFYEKDGTKTLFSPIGPEPAKVIRTILSREEATFSRIPEDVALEISDPSLEVTENREDFDYVYGRRKLAELKGAKYYPKRSFAEKAMEYGPKILGDEDMDPSKCMDLQEKWCDLRGCDRNKPLSEEAAAIHALFRNKKALGVRCIGIEVDGKVVAFAVGDRLNDETFVVHFEKADTDYKGMYQLINREFAKSLPEGIRFVNREQDLGVEGLRKAKLSYYPDFMVKKYTVKRKGGE